MIEARRGTFEGGELDRFEATPRAEPMDHLGFVEAVDCFGEGMSQPSPTPPTKARCPPRQAARYT